jgi:YegS/Rv2252/BmrU family lipid kinase
MSELEKAVHTVFPGASFRLTERQGHATKIAAEEGQLADLVIACGGDGTVHEVAKGLVESSCSTPMGVLGMGSGNDFARALQMPTSWKGSLSVLRSGRVVDVDTGRVNWKEGDGAHAGFFINALGIGFDAHSAVIAPRYKGYPFGTGYTLAILQSLRTWVSGGATIREDDRNGRVLFSGRLMFVTVGNAFDSGGGYTVNPGALISDGALDPCIVEHVSTLRSILLLPKIRSGKHIDLDEVIYERVRGLHVDTDRGLPVHADGEILSLQARDLQVSVRPGSLRVVIPANVKDPI